MARHEKGQADPSCVLSVVITRGPVPAGAADVVRDVVDAAVRRSRTPVRQARATLAVTEGQGAAHGAEAHADLDLDRETVRLRATAATVADAIVELDDQLADRFGRRRRRRRRPTGVAGTRVAAPTVQERVSFLRTTKVEQAVHELHDLEADFVLFTDADTHSDAAVSRDGTGRYRFGCAAGGGNPTVDRLDDVDVAPAPRLTVPEAVRCLAADGTDVLFFVDSDRDRGCVLHRSGDDYELVSPAL